MNYFTLKKLKCQILTLSLSLLNTVLSSSELRMVKENKSIIENIWINLNKLFKLTIFQPSEMSEDGENH